MPLTSLPVFFFSHGSPINAIENNYFTHDWKELYQGTETPKAIVIFSAHWHVPGLRITTASPLPTIHDFGGFPEALFQQQYPAATATKTATDIIKILNKHDYDVITDINWGLDHGSWVLLKHLQPKADIPVIQISLNCQKTELQWHYELAKILKPLRQEGVLFIGSGGIVHNIQKWMMSRPQDSIAWAHDFDLAISQAIDQRDINTLIHYQNLPYAAEAVPTVEHYLPLIYCMGLTDEQDSPQHSRFSNLNRTDLSLCCSRSIRFSKHA